jgi:hypothetical protein
MAVEPQPSIFRLQTTNYLIQSSSVGYIFSGHSSSQLYVPFGLLPFPSIVVENIEDLFGYMLADVGPGIHCESVRCKSTT